MANTNTRNNDKPAATPAPAPTGDNSPEPATVASPAASAFEPARGLPNAVQIPGNVDYAPNATPLELEAPEVSAPAEDRTPVYTVNGRRVGPNGYPVDSNGNEVFPNVKQRRRPR